MDGVESAPLRHSPGPARTLGVSGEGGGREAVQISGWVQAYGGCVELWEIGGGDEGRGERKPSASATFQSTVQSGEICEIAMRMRDGKKTIGMCDSMGRGLEVDERRRQVTKAGGR